mgnify:CR=1 FL=1
MTEAEIYQSFDSRVWAKEFCDIFERNHGFRPDEEWMISWFANALMRGYDEGPRAAWRDRTAADWLPSEVLFAFAGWLTSRRERVTFSASDDAAVAADLVAQFMKRHALVDPREGWERQIVKDVGGVNG